MTTWDDLSLSNSHKTLLQASGISPDTALARGYLTVTDAAELRALGYGDSGVSVPTLLVPLHDVDGKVWGYQHRPDAEFRNRDGRVLKYVSPYGQSVALDVPVKIRSQISDPSTPLLITEGSRKADSASERGLCCVSLMGVSCWRGTNATGGKTALAQWADVALNDRDVYIAYDNDVMSKPQVRAEATKLADYLSSKGASVRYILFPDSDEKIGLDDYLAAHPDSDVFSLAVDKLPAQATRSAGQGLGDRRKATGWAETYGQDFRWQVDKERWLAYQSGRWDAEGGTSYQEASVGGYLHELAELETDPDIARALSSTSTFTRVQRLTRTLPDLFVSRHSLDRQALLLNTPNGTVDLSTGKLRAHSPNDLLTQQTIAEYDPDAKCREFESFMAWALPDTEVRGFVKRLLGQALIGRVDEHVLPIFYGSGANGKGTLIRAITGVLGGDYTATASRSLLTRTTFEQHPTVIANLFKRRFMFSEETLKGAAFDEAIAKTLSGGDNISAHFMRQDEFTFEPTHTLFLSTNALPEVDDDEEALWRRLRLVPFTQKVESVDVELEHRIAAEGSGILNWLIEGCLEWQRDKSLGEPDAVLWATRMYRHDSNPFLSFIDSTVRITGDREDKVESAALYQSYRQWSQAAGEEPVKFRGFGGKVTKATGLKVERVGKQNESYYFGMRMREGAATLSDNFGDYYSTPDLSPDWSPDENGDKATTIENGLERVVARVVAGEMPGQRHFGDYSQTLPPFSTDATHIEPDISSMSDLSSEQDEKESEYRLLQTEDVENFESSRQTPKSVTVSSDDEYDWLREIVPTDTGLPTCSECGTLFSEHKDGLLRICPSCYSDETK